MTQKTKPALRTSQTFTFDAIGKTETPFKEKFGIPRQPGLAKAAIGFVQLKPHPFFAQALRGLETFSHIWIVFVFHAHDAKGWKPSIRPPRLGGAKKVGVLSSRSPHRPNPIGMSAVRLLSIDFDHPKGPRLEVEGIDLMDGTPVLDIKPYLPYADAYPRASRGWALEDVPRIGVHFSRGSLLQLRKLCPAPAEFKAAKKLIHDVLALDPRPAFQKKKFVHDKSIGARFGMALSIFDVHWVIAKTGFEITEIVLRSLDPEVNSKRTWS